MSQTTGAFGRTAQTPSGTHLGPGLTVSGELTGSDAVTLAGTFEGTVRTSEQVVVAETARVVADVDATSVRIQGQLEGTVRATERVDIAPAGRLTGDVSTARLSIADGAVFRGRIDMGS
jgi:cytoskeletal protein CcmA (bactofilin family)